MTKIPPDSTEPTIEARDQVPALKKFNAVAGYEAGLPFLKSKPAEPSETPSDNARRSRRQNTRAKEA